MHRLAALVALGASLLACRPEVRTDAPLVWGLRWEATSQPDSLDLATLYALGARHLSIELAVGSDAQGWPELILPDSAAWQALQRYLTRSDWRLTLALHASPVRPPFTQPVSPDRWLDHLGQELIDRLIPQAAGLPLERLVLGIDWRPLEPYTRPWQRLTDRLRRYLHAYFAQPVALTYGADARRLTRVAFWDVCDEIGLVVPPQEKRLPSEVRQQHRQADSLCAVWNKPLFVVQANLIGPNKLAELESRLSFWSDTLQHRGLTLNTIYPRSIWRDSSPWFGVATDSAFRHKVVALLKASRAQVAPK